MQTEQNKVACAPKPVQPRPRPALWSRLAPDGERVWRGSQQHGRRDAKHNRHCAVQRRVRDIPRLPQLASVHERDMPLSLHQQRLGVPNGIAWSGDADGVSG